MLDEQLKTLYETFRLANYRELFGRIREKDGSLSATEAYAADVIYLLKDPTVSAFAEVLGVSQPNATYKINNLEAKGYVSRSVSDSDRRECRVSVADRFHSYYDTRYLFLTRGLETLKRQYTPEQLALFESMLASLNGALEQ